MMSISMTGLSRSSNPAPEGPAQAPVSVRTGRIGWAISPSASGLPPRPLGIGVLLPRVTARFSPTVRRLLKKLYDELMRPLSRWKSVPRTIP